MHVLAASCFVAQVSSIGVFPTVAGRIGYKIPDSASFGEEVVHGLHTALTREVPSVHRLPQQKAATACQWCANAPTTSA